jgi:hypothetical protein
MTCPRRPQNLKNISIKKIPRYLWPQRKFLLKLDQGTYDPLGKAQKEIC